MGQFLWTGASALTQSDILAPERIEDTTATAEAAEWLLTWADCYADLWEDRAAKGHR